MNKFERKAKKSINVTMSCAEEKEKRAGQKKILPCRERGQIFLLSSKSFIISFFYLLFTLKSQSQPHSILLITMVV